MNVDALWWVRPVRPGDTLTVRRYAVNGLDAFGNPLSEEPLCLTFTRNVESRA